MALAAAGLLLGLCFGTLAYAAGDELPAAGLFGSALLCLALLVLSYFQRSLERQVRRFDQENDELRTTRRQLDAENEELKQGNKELKQGNKELKQNNAELATTSAAMREQVQHLNRLHNDSVAMIRQLALYGDTCKDFGRELGGIALSLHETDDSLGLQAHELEKQVAALGAVARALSASASAGRLVSAL